MTVGKIRETSTDAARAPRWSIPVRTAVIIAKVLLVYALSLKDAAFFYQQF